MPWRCPVWARPGDRRLLWIFGWHAGPRLPSAVSRGLAATTAPLMMDGCALLVCDDDFDVCRDFLSASARGGAVSGHEHSALHGVRVGAEGLERQLTL